MKGRLRQVRGALRSDVFWHAALVVYVLLVYGHSLIPAEISSQESGAVLEFLRRMSSAVHLPGDMLTEHIVRKTAHFLEYMGMGALLYLNARIMVRQRMASFQSMAAMAIWLPFLDETIQLFVRGRSGQISDVWLDMAGMWTGIAVMWYWRRAGEIRNRRRLR